MAYLNRQQAAAQISIIVPIGNARGKRRRRLDQRGVRLYHLAHAAGRRRGATHVPFYKIAKGVEQEDQLVALRVLHERMQPKRRLIQALRGEEIEDLGS